MFNEFLESVAEVQKEKEDFAIAYVVNRCQPSSGKPGDKAVIRKDGSLRGWIGGGCTRGIVIKEALAAIASGKPRIVYISPEGEKLDKPGVVEYPMTCHSGGAVEIFIEPVMSTPHLLVLGRSHVAMALARIAAAMDYRVSVIAPEADANAFPHAQHIVEEDPGHSLITPNTFIVVCTQGEHDETALAYALQSRVDYLAFVSSRRKANAMFQNLRAMGFTFDDLKRIKTPAGLDINAKMPQEVAISILAEIVSHLRSKKEEEKGSSAKPQPKDSAIYINPVCGIPVEKSTAKHVIEYKEEKYYFCCDGCKVSFEKEPEKYAHA